MKHYQRSVSPSFRSGSFQHVCIIILHKLIFCRQVAYILIQTVHSKIPAPKHDTLIIILHGMIIAPKEKMC
jgi:hypothetical protein